MAMSCEECGVPEFAVHREGCSKMPKDISESITVLDPSRDSADPDHVPIRLFLDRVHDEIEARLNTAARAGLHTQMGFESVLLEMGHLRLEKVVQYGEDRYQDRWSEPEEMWMIYSDIYRKFIRLRQQVLNGDLKGMRETCLDLANYGAMGVQLIDKRFS